VNLRNFFLKASNPFKIQVKFKFILLPEFLIYIFFENLNFFPKGKLFF
jgi:hypothetical protein